MQFTSQILVTSWILPFFITTQPVFAQITPDGTTSTTVTPTPQGVQINQGDSAGGNLFHSFGQFSVPNGTEAHFNNASDVVNIFSRVTGGDISEINGLIRANGGANLFLINPAGILFGEGARLQLGGSFYGSTADSIIFPDGEFSATDLDNPVTITINAPIGLGFRDNPGDIINKANTGLVETIIDPGLETEYNVITEIPGLEVLEGKTLGLIGGDIFLDGGGLTAPGGNVELGGLTEAGTVTLNSDGSLTFPEGVTRSDVSLTNNAIVNVESDGGGFINVNARNLTLDGKGRLIAGIKEDMGSSETVGGDIVINTTESVKVIGTGEAPPEASLRIDTGIVTRVGLPPGLRDDPEKPSTAVGQGGSIIINSQLLEVRDREAGIVTLTDGTGDAGSLFVDVDSLNVSNATIGTFTSGKGNTSEVNIEANDIFLDSGVILSQILFGAEANAGDINITANSFEAINGTFIGSNNDSDSNGNAGDINIIASEIIKLDSGSLPLSGLAENAVGNSGDINLTAPNIILDNGALIIATTSGQGDAGAINITASNSLTIDNGSFLLSEVKETALGNGRGISIFANSFDLKNGSLVKTESSSPNNDNAGNIVIESNESINLDSGQLISGLTATAVGKAGNITLTAPTINFKNGSLINTNTLGIGDAGTISLTANDVITVDNGSKFLSEANEGAQGNAGNIIIESGNLISLDNGSELISKLGANSTGNAGNVNLTSTKISLNNGSNLFAQVESNAEGNAGNISLSSENTNLNNGSLISATTSGQGDAGTINITANDALFLDNGSLVLAQVKEGAEGNAGNIQIQTNFLTFDQESLMISDSNGNGSGGNITFEIGNKLLLDNKSLIRSGIEANGVGDAGDITVNAPNIVLNNASGFSLGTKGQGEAGNLNLTADSFSMNNTSFVSSSSSESAVGNGGTITLNSDLISIINESSINGFTTTGSDAGAITINANNLELKQGGAIFAATNAEGNAGNIQLNIAASIIFDGVKSSDSTQPEPPGNPFLLEVFGKTGLFANTSKVSQGDGGNITVNTNQITLENNAQITADSLGEGAGGSISVNARDLNLNQTTISATTISPQPEGDSALSNINLSIAENLTLRNNSTISTEAGSNANAGNLNIDAGFIIAYPSNGEGNDIITKAEQGAGGDIEINAEGLLGIEERTASSNNGTNDIDASSRFGLDGNVLINTSYNDPLREDTELPQKVVTPGVATTDACEVAATEEDASGLVVKGKGGVPPEPSEPLEEEALVPETSPTANNSEETPQETTKVNPGYIPPHIKPVAYKPNGEPIYIARGVIVHEDGSFTLTAYPTPGTPGYREYMEQMGCNIEQ